MKKKNKILTYDDLMDKEIPWLGTTVAGVIGTIVGIAVIGFFLLVYINGCIQR